MASINQATIIGFIGDEPKINTTQAGRKVASFAVATTEKGYKTQNGTTYTDRTEWHNVVLWGKLAEVAEKYLHKGTSVFVQGKMRTRSYDDKNGVKRYITEIDADVMQMLDRKDNNSNQGVQQTPQLQNQQQSYAVPNNPSSNKKEADDDLPF